MYIGNNEITKVYLGSEEVTKIYQGNTVVWEQSDTPTPPIGPTTPFGEWYTENEDRLMNSEEVVLCQTLLAETSFLNQEVNYFEATGETSGEIYNIDMMSGRIDVSPDYNITQGETEIDGYTYKTVNFGETVKVNDQMKMSDLNSSCEAYYNGTGIQNPVMLA